MSNLEHFKNDLNIQKQMMSDELDYATLGSRTQANKTFYICLFIITVCTVITMANGLLWTGVLYSLYKEDKNAVASAAIKFDQLSGNLTAYFQAATSVFDELYQCISGYCKG